MSRTGLSPAAAGAVVGGTLGLTAWLASRHPPTPNDPETFHWYQSLEKPGWTPPGPVIGTVWSVIETGLAWGGYRLLRQPRTPARDAAAALWIFNVGMIGGWSEIFFGTKRLGVSALASGAMIGTGAAYIATATKVDRKAAATGVPYVAWLCLATVLATEVWRLNRNGSSEDDRSSGDRRRGL
jgi:translocator protein